MKRYYVVWVPMSSDMELSVIKDKFGPICEKDIPAEDGVVFEGKIDAQSLDVSLSYVANNLQGTLKFHCESKNKRGLLVYSLYLNEANADFLQSDLETHLPSCIYNYIKGFFHEHKWHDGNEDSVLPSFCFNELVDLSSATIRGEVINQLLDAYQIKFEGHLESWSDSLLTLSQKILHGSKPYSDLFALLERVTDSYNVCGELDYCEFLLAQFKQDVSRARRKELRKLMASIVKTSNDMRACYDRYISIVSLNDGRNSKIFGWIGFILSIVSIILTLLSIGGAFGNS